MEQPAPILDLRYLVDVTSGDTKFIAEILGDYLREMETYLGELDSSFSTRTYDTLLRAAHTIKGASANVGATRVQDIAARLETQAQKGSLDGGTVLIKILRSEIARVKDLIERHTVDELMRAT